ncbi:helix-turn-helix domain-containing protein [Microbacterium enclense]|uniref:helix-turn-helix domain-containing protein n=1 Tax=Microbacterium enclense TaxID=993073 RepID=UPI003F7FF76E
MPGSALALAMSMRGPDASAGSSRSAGAMVSRLVTPAHYAMTIVFPSDPSLREIAEKILMDPTGPHITERYAAAAGVRATTLSSRFRHQTGLSHAQWHFHVRLYAAVALLGRGISTGAVAHAVGFSGPSGLSSAHKRLFGVTPMAFKRRGRRIDPDAAEGSELAFWPCLADPLERTPPELP